MKIQKFEDIIAWQKAQDLAVDVYEIFREIRILVSKIRYVGQRLRFQITLPKDLTEVQMQIFVGFFIFPWHLVVK